MTVKKTLKSVINSISTINRLTGIDRAISYGVLASLWGILAGPITLFIVALRLSNEQQGFYYTIVSLLALQIFFELGFSAVITAFTSHEFAKLKWGASGKIYGDSTALERITDLISKFIKWYGLGSILLIALLIPAGLLFFEQGANTIDFSWRIPWILAVIGTAINLFISPFFAVIMGSGDVVFVNQRGLIGSIIGSCLSWIVLGLHGGLYAIFAVSLGSIVISCRYLLKKKPYFMVLAFRGMLNKAFQNDSVKHSISWRNEIWPMQWKIALSWISGYFVFQLFNPILFHYHGAHVAGQMGMTLTAANAFLGMSVVWMASKTPEFGMLIAKNQWNILDRIFFKVLKQTLLIVTSGAIIAWIFIYFLQMNYEIGRRFLPPSQTALLFSAVGLQAVIYGFATYLRAHKKEPLMLHSVVGAILQGGAALLLGIKYSSFGMVMSYSLITLLYWLPIVFFTWKYYRRIWHR